MRARYRCEPDDRISGKPARETPSRGKTAGAVLSPLTPEPFELRVYPGRERVRVVVVGELDLATAGRLEARLRELGEAGFEHLVLDLHGLTFIDCAGLRAVLAADRRACQDGKRFGVICPDGPVRRLLTLTDVHHQLIFWRDRLPPCWPSPRPGAGLRRP